MKVVINDCYGGFSLSHDGVMEYAKQKGIRIYAFVDQRKNGEIIFGKYKKYTPKSPAPWLIHYSTKPLDKKGQIPDKFYFSERRAIPRDDPALIKTVEKLGAKANGSCAKLKIIEIPDNIKWNISEYDGLESVEEEHRSWR